MVGLLDRTVGVGHQDRIAAVVQNCLNPQAGALHFCCPLGNPRFQHFGVLLRSLVQTDIIDRSGSVRGKRLQQVAIFQAKGVQLLALQINHADQAVRCAERHNQF